MPRIKKYLCDKIGRMFHADLDFCFCWSFIFFNRSHAMHAMHTHWMDSLMRSPPGPVGPGDQNRTFFFRPATFPCQRSMISSLPYHRVGALIE